MPFLQVTLTPVGNILKGVSKGRHIGLLGHKATWAWIAQLRLGTLDQFTRLLRFFE
jgi:hypothetical protein